MRDTRNDTCALAAIAIGWVAVLGPAHAQETGKVMIDVAECIKLEAPEARLACYESRVAAVSGERAARAAAARSSAPAPATAAAVPSPANGAEPAPRTESAAPTLAPPVAESVQSRSRSDRPNRSEQKPAAAEPQGANDIVSRVKELREVVPNAWQITLENGQVWRQTASKRYGLKSGQQVRIYGTRWGSASRLSTDEFNGYIQVERVR